MRRVVISGLGVVSPLGCDMPAVWQKLQAGESGIGPITKFDATDFASRIAGEVSDFDPSVAVDRKAQRRMDEFSLFALVAAKSAVEDSGIDFTAEDPTRMGVIVNSGIGGLQTLEVQQKSMLERGPSRCSPFMIPQMIINMAGGLIAIEYNCQGPNFAVVTACASASHGIGESLRLIQHGDADVIISGGTEASVCKLGVGGFCAMRALSTRNDDPTAASRPFDVDRNGFVIADGAAILVLEELEHAKARGATIYCELAGFGMSCDAFHITAPSEDGDGASRAMKNAMNDAGVTPEEVSYINAHGTSTQLNDIMETKAIKGALGEAAKNVMVSSTKSMTGHMLGAAGGFEAAAVALALRDQVVPPTINHHNPDPQCDLDYVPLEARKTDVNVCLSNSLGFGGHNACVAFKKM
ncbi:MAG: beta-ketoacyl-ACP synthase II [Kiritimatiellia bacterium]|nr:beta-ketoacyl-ACP synthase II [Kiritimatiellia bacterium]MDP6810542.1 beta-ketoacyl-ACP synthase II [Kiritimatiellia bacterium]MDP7024942.1 beta-ketoacyl-ACP synthase II [Kiritimatiellia bacterium]